jgi:hypothetical protein
VAGGGASGEAAAPCLSTYANWLGNDAHSSNEEPSDRSRPKADSEASVSAASIVRRVALILAHHAARILPSVRSSWAEAMIREVEFIESDRAALAWAVGSVLASYAERVRSMNLIHTLWVSWMLAVLALWQALRMFFAPSLTIAYRLHELGIANALGARTPGDDYHRFIPLMDATPNWLLGIWVLSGLLCLATAWRLLRNRHGAYPFFVAALLLQLAGEAVVYLMPAYAQIAHDTFTFAQANFRRDYLIPTAQLIIPAMLAVTLWWKDRRSGVRPT